MKKSILLYFSLIFLWGCATAPDPQVVLEEPVSEEPEIQEEVVVETIEEPVVYVDVKIPHLLTETRFFRDGSVDTRTAFLYQEESGIRIKQEKTNGAGELIQSFEYEIVDGMTVKRNELNGDGSLNGYILYEYDDAGNLIIESSFNSKNELQLSSEYLLDEKGNRIERRVLDGNSIVLSYIKYFYENNLNIRSELYDSSGGMTNYFVREYDGDNNLIKELSYNREGVLDAEVEFLYEAGFLVFEEHKNKSGGLVRRFAYENDEDGSPVNISLESNRGIILETVEKSYFYTTEKIIAE